MTEEEHQVHELSGKTGFSASSEIRVMDKASLTVIRGVNEARLSALMALIAVSIGAGIAVGFATTALGGVIAFAATLIVVVLVLRLLLRGGKLTHWTMELMHRITGK